MRRPTRKIKKALTPCQYIHQQRYCGALLPQQWPVSDADFIHVDYFCIQGYTDQQGWGINAKV